MIAATTTQVSVREPLLLDLKGSATDSALFVNRQLLPGNLKFLSRVETG